ncbi:family 43 glycosylhydrolase [Mucilaginibacter sp. L196]|uniref:family 43 glycosylhydrolase n=1 Tax=Mucilaginibacter sp. L196 TaxID=1641870 RepID=UPI00131D7D34|nr:family 43 glycosylhydrolase [Mucilaginibacter sp. L196]
MFFINGNAQTVKPTNTLTAYLFTYFTGGEKGEEAIRFAISNDGYNFRALNANNPVLNSSLISSTGGVRDPHILRGADGHSFYMVATDMQVAKNGWGPNYAMVFMHSEDLINWKTSIVNIPDKFHEFAGVNRVWAPQTIYDNHKKMYMVYWSMREGNGPDKIYYAYANKDFSGLITVPKQLFFSPGGFACIDADIAFKNGKYHLFFKTEDQLPGIKQAISSQLTSGYIIEDNHYLQKTDEAVEGSGTFKLNNSDEWILMYDVYKKGKYQFTKSKDLKNFTVIDQEVSMNFHPRHGTVMSITGKEAQALINKWYTTDDVITYASAGAIKKQNIALDTAHHEVYLPVNSNAQLHSFNPLFLIFPGVKISPAKPQNFTKGPVKYKVSITNHLAQTYQVNVQEDHNPVLSGFYADPEILYAQKTGKFYIYPTSDGFTNWSGTYFKVFSSANLVDWKDEGKILDLDKDVTWAHTNAWAPCIIEKKINDKFKYFYYFVAAQKIGVAVADDPLGPFIDSGKPLIDHRPEGITGGQQIDPDVFSDPKTGKSYLYWGNGYLAGAELNDDMISIKTETTRILTPDATFREGTYVFYRNGKYYITWSEDDTRSPNYKVRYGITDSPLGKISIPDNNIVIQKNVAAGIYGTGHNAVLQLPGKDEWYLVYHRFNYPNGIFMGDAAGYNREVCIDKMDFESDGRIKQVIPTKVGIKAVTLNKLK